MTSERGFELRRRGHHEAQPGVGVGELALQIEEIRARDVPGLERVAARDDLVGRGAARRQIFEPRRAIEDAQAALAQAASEFRGADELALNRHGRLPTHYCASLECGTSHE